MSRTYKDRPRYVWELEALRKGFISHDHRNSEKLDRPRLPRKVRVQWNDGYLPTRHYPEHQKNYLREYREFLIEQGVLFHEFEEDIELGGNEDSYYPDLYYTKTYHVTTVAPYEEKFSIWSKGYSSECPAPEDFVMDKSGSGSTIWTVAGSGKVSRCTPDSKRLRKPKNRRSGYYNVGYRTSARDEALKAIKTHRAGEMDEFFDSPDLYSLQLHKSNCGCFCCY